MRSTDPEPAPWQPLGERVPKAPAPAPELRRRPALKPGPQGPSGIVIDENGRRSTTTHPKEPKP